jgi:hypothetical protein
MADRPVEILALAPKLHELFDGLLPVYGTTEQDELNFLSRALAAFSVHKLAGTSLQEAADAVVDGADDAGIDAVYISEASETLWLIQSKYTADGLSEPDLQSVIRYTTGVTDLLSGQHDEVRRNAVFASKLDAISALLSGGSPEVKGRLCYSGLRLVSEDRKPHFDRACRAINRLGDDFLEFNSVNLSTIHTWVAGVDGEFGVDVPNLVLHSPGEVSAPFETVFGLVKLDDLAELYADHGVALLAENLRGFKGSTDVNDEIFKTATEEPDKFIHLNNGLTAYCDRLEINYLDRNRREYKRYNVRGLSIINGAQTIGSIARACAARPNDANPPDGFAFLKIISLERCDDEPEYANRISRSANFQNAVTLKDFAAAYPLHQQLHDTLLPFGIGYHFRLDEDTPDSDEDNFTIEEGLTACACLHNPDDCDLLVRVASNRNSLRSLDPVFPIGSINRHRHGQVFPQSLSARTLWRAVQVQRLVIARMGAATKASTGALRSFNTNARWIILAAIFKKLKPQLGEALLLTPEEATTVSDAADEYKELLLAEAVAKGFASYETMPGGQMILNSNRDFQSIFKLQADCQILWRALRASIFALAPVIQPENTEKP